LIDESVGRLVSQVVGWLIEYQKCFGNGTESKQVHMHHLFLSSCQTVYENSPELILTNLKPKMGTVIPYPSL